MYLTARKTKIGIRITLWCKMLTLKAYLPKRKFWKQRRDRRYKRWSWANGIIGGRIKR